MQKIQLSVVKFTEENGYSVYLGNGTTHYFTSEKLAKRFLANASKRLSTLLYNLHDIYDVLQHKYNDCWAYMDKQPVKARKIREELQAAETSFEAAVSACYREDGNTWAFIHLLKAIHSLMLIVKQLERENFKRSLAHQRYQFDNLFSRLQTIEADLTTYGQRTADVIVIPQHISSMKSAAG